MFPNRTVKPVLSGNVTTLNWLEVNIRKIINKSCLIGQCEQKHHAGATHHSVEAWWKGAAGLINSLGLWWNKDQWELETWLDNITHSWALQPRHRAPDTASDRSLPDSYHLSCWGWESDEEMSLMSGCAWTLGTKKGKERRKTNQRRRTSRVCLQKKTSEGIAQFQDWSVRFFKAKKSKITRSRCHITIIVM